MNNKDKKDMRDQAKVMEDISSMSIITQRKNRYNRSYSEDEE